MLGVDNVTLGLSHGIGHHIGARCGVPHGITSCVMLQTVMTRVVDVMPRRLADLASVMDPAEPAHGAASEFAPRTRRCVARLNAAASANDR
jgi:alcohol dehydrogenase class IV